MFMRFHDTGLTSANAAWVPGSGDSNGDRLEWSWRAWAQVNVLLPAMSMYFCVSTILQHLIDPPVVFWRSL